MMSSPNCICDGNLSKIIHDTNHLFDRKFKYRDVIYTFIGITYASDDLYYLMWNKDEGIRLLSCVGAIEGFGFELIDEPDTDEDNE